MTTLLVPNFTLPRPNPSALYPDTVWWLWCRIRDHAGSDLELGGIYADKPGFHNTGKKNRIKWPNNYSIRDKINQWGVGWEKGSALDLTFRSAQSGDYRNIDRYTSRLVKSALDPKDPRLDMVLFEFFGQADFDLHVEGYNEFREEEVTSGLSHLWHLHLSFIRSLVGDWWGMWALYAVLIGWNVEQWRATVPQSRPVPAPKPVPVTGLPVVKLGSRMLRNLNPDMRGTDVLTFQKFIGGVKADGVFADATEKRTREYQRMRGYAVDGIAGPQTLGPIIRALG